MCDIRYFKRALSLYKTAVREYQAGQTDEYTMNTVAYSLQQVVELVLKCHLEFVGCHRAINSRHFQIGANVQEQWCLHYNHRMD